MKVHITKVETITAKTGKVYQKIHGVSLDGSVLELFIDEEMALKVGNVKESSLSEEELKEALGGFQPVEVYFNQRGRIDDIKL